LSGVAIAQPLDGPFASIAACEVLYEFDIIHDFASGQTGQRSRIVAHILALAACAALSPDAARAASAASTAAALAAPAA